jgi:hypothetical protein
MAKLQNPDRDHWCVLNKREFTAAKDVATGLPVKRLSSRLFKGNTADGRRYTERFQYRCGASRCRLCERWSLSILNNQASAFRPQSWAPRIRNGAG